MPTLEMLCITPELPTAVIFGVFLKPAPWLGHLPRQVMGEAQALQGKPRTHSIIKPSYDGDALVPAQWVPALGGCACPL